MIRLVLAPGLLAALLLGAPADTFAELFRCVRPDGRTVFTDSPSGCARTLPHEPAGAVQSSGPSHRTPPPAASVPEPGGGLSPGKAEARREARWRERRRQAEAELARVESEHAELEAHLTHCNRGGALYTTRTSGLRSQVSCDSVRERVAALEASRAELRAYLDHGIHEECRRAGCLPGWLRGE